MTELGTNIESGAIKVQKKPPVGMPERVKIMLEESGEIPPTGLFIGVNGTGYLLRPGEAMEVPASVVEVLDHAIMSMPQLDPSSGQVIGYRERMRYPYRKL